MNKNIETEIKDTIFDIVDFPKKGIIFRDLTPILGNHKVFSNIIDELYERTKDLGYTMIVAPESRGFWFGIPLANKAKVGFVPVRKPKKLPRAVYSEEFSLEYGKDCLQMHIDALKPTDKVLIVDDLIATGGTIQAIFNLVKQAKAAVVGFAFVVSLSGLPGLKLLNDNYHLPVVALADYDNKE